MKNKDSKARMQMIFGILLFAFIFMAELYAIVNFPKMFIVLVVLAAADTFMGIFVDNSSVEVISAGAVYLRMTEFKEPFITSVFTATSHNPYASQPEGDCVSVAKEVFNKVFPNK